MRAPRIAATHQECKVVKTSAVAMALWFVLVFFASENKPSTPQAMPGRADVYCSAPVGSGAEGGADVSSVTVVVRHGARSGISAENHDWSCALGPLKQQLARWEAASGTSLTPETDNGKCIKGQLVARGFRQHRHLGAFLRSKYGGAQWAVTTRSTNYQRTKASASAFLEGFFGGRVPRDAWPRWREHADEEAMFGVEGEDGKGLRCEKAAAGATRQREAWAPDPERADAVASIEGAAANPTDLADVAYSRHCEHTGCLKDTSGRCVTSAQAEALFQLADLFYYGRYTGGDGGRDASKLGMHPFLTELLENFRSDVAAPSGQRRLRLYAGHDTVIAPLLSTLGVFDGRWPPLASRIVFELRGANLRILFNGRDVSGDVCPGAAAADDLDGGPPASRAGGCPLAAFEARVAALLGGAASFDEACGN